MKPLIGINPLDVEGSVAYFGKGYGYGISKFVNISFNGKKYTPVITGKANTFGIKHEDRIPKNAICRIKEQKKFLEFYAKSGKVELNNPFIVGISMFHLGNPIWGPNTGFDLGKIKDYKSIKISPKVDFKAIKGHGNFVVDMFLTEKRENKVDFKTGSEIEIWFATSFPPPGEKIAETKDFEIFYQKKTTETQNWFNVLPKKNSIELLDVVKAIKKKAKNIYDLNIRSLDTGSEFSTNSEIKTKLYKIDFDFKK